MWGCGAARMLTHWWKCKTVKSLWKILKLFLKVNHTLSKQRRSSTPMYLFKRNEYTKTCAWMFIATLFTVAPNGKHPKYPSTVEWINKMYIHMMEYYSAIKRNELCYTQPCGCIPESRYMKEAAQECTYCMIPFI